MKKKRMEYCEVISYVLPYHWMDSSIDALKGVAPRGYIQIYDTSLPTTPSQISTYTPQNNGKKYEWFAYDDDRPSESPYYYEYPGERNRACIYYGTDGYVKKFELDTEGNTRFFASALDAVNWLATKGWYLHDTFKSHTTVAPEAPSLPNRIIEHWIMAREIEVDE